MSTSVQPYLVVTSPFLGYGIGATITDPGTIMYTLATNPGFVVASSTFNPYPVGSVLNVVKSFANYQAGTQITDPATISFVLAYYPTSVVATAATLSPVPGGASFPPGASNTFASMEFVYDAIAPANATANNAVAIAATATAAAAGALQPGSLRSSNGPVQATVTTRAPTSADDVTAGYVVGSLWNAPSGLFVAQQVTAGHAVWTASTIAALPIDAVGGTAPIAAYGTRKLRAGYTGFAINVVRASDSATLDVGFAAGGGLDTASLDAFSANTTLNVAIWYDQSGNANHATQTTATNRPSLSPTSYTGNVRSVVFDSQIDSSPSAATQKWMTLPAGVAAPGTAVSLFVVSAAYSSYRLVYWAELTNATKPQTFFAFSANTSFNVTELIYAGPKSAGVGPVVVAGNLWLRLVVDRDFDFLGQQHGDLCRGRQPADGRRLSWRIGVADQQRDRIQRDGGGADLSARAGAGDRCGDVADSADQYVRSDPASRGRVRGGR